MAYSQSAIAILKEASADKNGICVVHHGHYTGANCKFWGVRRRDAAGRLYIDGLLESVGSKTSKVVLGDGRGVNHIAECVWRITRKGISFLENS